MAKGSNRRAAAQIDSDLKKALAIVERTDRMLGILETGNTDQLMSKRYASTVRGLWRRIRASNGQFMSPDDGVTQD